MADDDCLQVGYRRLAARLLLQAIRDLERGDHYAEGACRFLRSPGAALLAGGLGIEVRTLLSWLDDREARDSAAVKILVAPASYVPVGEACALLGISRSTGIQRIRDGAWHGCRVGRLWFVLVTDAEAEVHERTLIEGPPEGYVPVAEACAWVGCSRSTGCRRVASGTWRGMKIRGLVYVNAADVEAEANIVDKVAMAGLE